MIYLAQGGYLLLILLIPLMFIAYWLMRRFRRKRISRFGDPELVAQLTPEVPRRKGWAKLTIISIALFFFSLGMARPQIGATLKERQIKGAEIMVVLDVSNSMLAEDYSPNRLERAKLAISKLVDELQGDRIGLIIFAGESFVQLPITSDYVSAKIFLNSITTESDIPQLDYHRVRARAGDSPWRGHTDRHPRLHLRERAQPGHHPYNRR